MTRRPRPGHSRALRYGVGASMLVLAVCAVIAGLSAVTLDTVGARIATATARSQGEVLTAAGHTAEIHWSASGVPRTDTVELAGTAPPAGTRTEVAYDPRQPTTVFIPGSAELAAMDRAASGVAFSGLIATMVVSTLGWQLAGRRRLHRRGVQTRPVRRVRVQAGLLTRSWLELDQVPARWIPVHFDPVLITLPAPAQVQVYGDPFRHRLVAAGIDGVRLYPSGPVRSTEPRGRRIDSPTHPDDDARRSAARSGWRRQLRADAALITPAPLIGLLWTFLDDGDVLTWACATMLAAALALWWAALRGSDPT